MFTVAKMAGWIKMVLGMEVGLSPVDFELDGDHGVFCYTVMGTQPPLNFRPMFIIVIVISLEHCAMHSRYAIGLFKFKF